MMPLYPKSGYCSKAASQDSISNVFQKFQLHRIFVARTIDKVFDLRHHEVRSTIKNRYVYQVAEIKYSGARGTHQDRLLDVLHEN